MAKNHLASLTQQLESYSNVTVLDAAYEGDGLYSLKLQTPRHVYLDTGTFRDWITLVQDDIRQSQQRWHCPFCHHRLPNHDDALPISCPGCSALGWCVDCFPSPVPQIIYDQFCASWSPAQAYQALSRQHSVFILQETPSGIECLWIDPPSLKTMPEAPEWVQTAGVAPDSTASGHIPVYLDQDATFSEPLPQTLDDLKTAQETSRDCSPYQLPTCFTCRHVLTIPTTDWNEPVRVCQYPWAHLGSVLERHPIGYASGTSFDNVSCGQSAINTLQNLLLDHALQPFPPIDKDALEGYIPSLHRFHSPICARYHENPETLEEDNLLALPITVPIAFNMVNIAKLQQRQRIAQAQTLLTDTIDRLTTLRQDPDTHRLMTQRVTKTNLDSEEAQSVIAFLRENIPPDLLATPYVQPLKRFFDYSNAAWTHVIASLNRDKPRLTDGR